MEKLLSHLLTIPEYKLLTKAIAQNKSAAVTGVGQLCRSQLIAALHTVVTRPMVVICQDDMAAKKLQDDLNAFLGTTFPVLPSRDLTLYDTAVVSRGWEQKRLRQLYDLATGTTKLQIMSWEAMSQRTVPMETLTTSAFRLRVGQEYAIDAMLERLTASGYSRCSMVEGPGQFALRGGILDIFSPAADRPFRAEFFGDELDTMGYFDPDTQRRTENVDEAIILPVGETQPRLHPGGIQGLCDDLRSLIARQKRRKNIHEELIKTLERDLDAFENGRTNPAADRYMALIYPEFATALDHVPEDALVIRISGGESHDNVILITKDKCFDYPNQRDGFIFLWVKDDGTLGYRQTWVFPEYLEQSWIDALEQLTGRDQVLYQTGRAEIVGDELDLITEDTVVVSDYFDLDTMFAECKAEGWFEEYETLDELFEANKARE